MATTYIAGRRINVEGSFRNRGDAVPEAAGWKNLNTYLRIGHIIKIDTDDVMAFQESQPGATTAEVEAASPYEGMKGKDLSALAKERGVKAASRKKADILAALIEADAAEQTGDEDEADEPDDGE